MDEQTKFNVTDKQVEEAITQEVYLQVGFKTSVCVLIVNTGFEAIGSFSPIDPKAVDVAAGKTVARERAAMLVRGHLEGIAQWRKAVHDIREAELLAQEAKAKAAADANQPNSQGPVGPSASGKDPVGVAPKGKTRKLKK